MLLALTWIITEVGNQSPYIKFFDLGDGFKPCSDDFFVFSEPENGGSHLVWPGGLPYGLRGVPKGKSSKGPQKWPSKMGFSHKITKSSQKCVESGGNGWKHVINHFCQLSTHFWALFVILWYFLIFEGHFWGHLEDFPCGTLRDHKSPKNFVKRHVPPKIVPRFRKNYQNMV